MFDLHSHILPGIDDGAKDLALSLDMARDYVEQGVKAVACTPHILPGLYPNTGVQIREAVARLQSSIDEAGIPLRLVSGADNHIVPDFVQGLLSGHLLSLADSRYVLVEPPHHVVPERLEDLFFNIQVAKFVPILTHPERLTWIEKKYDIIQRLAARGVWMQITTGSLLGTFGQRARYWAERMLREGIVHILASDAHNLKRRPPDLHKGRLAAELIVGTQEAHHLVVTRPYGILTNCEPNDLPVPCPTTVEYELRGQYEYVENSGTSVARGLGQRLRRLFRN